MRTPIKLRYHHFLCISCYEGKGYNKEFISNFDTVYNQIRYQGRKIVPTRKLDTFCNSCPSRMSNSQCEVEPYIKKLDKSIKKVLDLRASTELNWDELQKRIIDKLTIQNFEKICKNCTWYNICKEKMIQKLKNI